MNSLIEENKTRLAEECRRFGVQRLKLFGSAARDDFDPAKSDFDFIVSFADRAPGTYADRYLDFTTAVEVLLGRRVDMLTERSIRNPVFRKEVDAVRQIIYGQ